VCAALSCLSSYVCEDRFVLPRVCSFIPDTVVGLFSRFSSLLDRFCHALDRCGLQRLPLLQSDNSDSMEPTASASPIGTTGAVNVASEKNRHNIDFWLACMIQWEVPLPFEACLRLAMCLSRLKVDVPCVCEGVGDRSGPHFRFPSVVSLSPPATFPTKDTTASGAVQFPLCFSLHLDCVRGAAERWYGRPCLL